MASANSCPKCGADLLVVGVSAVVEETAIFMGHFGDERLLRIGAEDRRRVVRASCRACLAEQPTKFVETLQVA